MSAATLVPADAPVGLLSQAGMLVGCLAPSGSTREIFACRRKALEIMIKTGKNEGTPPILTASNEISAHCFDLKLKNQSDRADEIATALQRLKEKMDPKDNAANGLESVLRLLVHLKESHPDDETMFENRDPLFPFASAIAWSKSSHWEKSVRTNFVSEYRTFAPEHFEIKTPNAAWAFGGNPYSVINGDIFRQTPGIGLNVLPETRDLKINLFIPPLELTSDKRGRFLRVPVNTGVRSCIKKDPKYLIKNYQKRPRDDGEICDDTWEKIWEVELPARKTWESLGKLSLAKEKPYLTELDAKGVHKSWLIAMENLRLVDNSTIIPDIIVMTEKQLVTDIGYLMIGIASDTFMYDSAKDYFIIRAGTCIEGITPESFDSLCQEFLRCGIICRRLEVLCGFQSECVSSEALKMGQIYVGFMNGISKYLQGYRTAVLNVVGNKHLLGLSLALSPLSNQIQFLGRLCKLHPDCSESDTEFPVGIELLCYLFDRTLHINARDLYFVLVSILRSSAEPYFRFLERWIFHGVYLDEFHEFGLDSQTHFLNSRNRLFWTNAYVTTEFPLDSSVCKGGHFISDIQQQVYLCGKSLNLLKICQPLHHLCSIKVNKQPKIQLLVSPIEQAELKTACHQFVEYMNEVAQEKTTTLQKIKEKEEEDKKALLRVAHKRHKEVLERIRLHRKSVLEEEEKRKRIVFEQLKQQALAESKRKAEEKKKQLEDDKKWAEFAQKKEEEDIRREELVRKEMEDYYKRLTAESEKREKRAIWKTERLNLKEERITFFRNENKKMQELIKNLEQNQQNNLSNVVVKEEQLWKSIRVEEDEMKNLVLVLEDQESNIVQENVTNFDEFSSDTRQLILNQSFNNLPKWTKIKLMENHEKKSKQVVTNSDVIIRRKDISPPKTNSSTKRKRPESFIESAVKRQDQETYKNEPTFYESLASALSKDDTINGNVKKRRPKELSTIDGRKRPTSKSIEQVLYPSRFSIHQDDNQSPVTPSKTEFILADFSLVQPYAKEFEGMKSQHVENFTSRLFPVRSEIRVDPQAFTPLTMLMENSVLIPLRAQLTVVNNAVVNYLLVDAGLMNHFKALRNYLLFHDGEFAHHLSYSLFSQVQDNAVSDVLHPATLNRIVENAIMSSTFGSKDPLADNVGFSFGDSDEVGDIFRCLRLGYKTDWPINVIVTQDVVDIYGELFQFLLQLKKAVWGLEQVFVGLKSLRSYQSHHQVRKVHLMRHDMLNFVNVTQDYVKTQVLDVSWAEFERDIQDKVNSLDSLYEAHMRYLTKALKRCILSRKAKAQAVQKVIVDIFNIIAKFSLLLSSLPWNTEDQDVEEVTHPSFLEMEETYSIFREYSSFLYTVVDKMAVRGYEHHLNDLLLCLNYNGYYNKKPNQ